MQSRKNRVFPYHKGLIILMDKERYISIWNKRDQQTNKKVDKEYKQQQFTEKNMKICLLKKNISKVPPKRNAIKIY